MNKYEKIFTVIYYDQRGRKTQINVMARDHRHARRVASVKDTAIISVFDTGTRHDKNGRVTYRS